MGVRAIIATCIGVLSVTLFTAPAQAAFPGQNGKFVFRTGNDALYTRNSDGSGFTTIPSSAGLEAPAWSPDGQRIAAYSFFYDDVIIMDADGSNVTPMQLYPSGSAQPPAARTARRSRSRRARRRLRLPTS